MQDIYLVILILGTLFGTIFSAIYYKKGLNPVKKAKKNAEISIFDNLVEYREVEKGTITDILKQKDNQIKSLNRQLQLLQPELIEEDQNIKNNKKNVTFEEIQALVKQAYPKYSFMLALPGAKKQIMDITKGMSLEEILDYVKQITGAQQSEGSPQGPESLGYNPNWA